MSRVPPRRFGLVVLSFLLMVLATAPAFAQGGGGTTSLSGVVVDTSGAVIPGADVTLKNDATGVAFNAITSERGTFTIPALQAGKYTATVTLSGFKTAVVPNIVLNTDTPGTIRVSLELGALEETVVVQGGTEIVQTQASTISTTVDVKQITALPTNTRNALDFVTSLPGVNTPGSNRDSTVNGLPQSAINITLDGMSIQDNYLKSSDGFFTRVRPSLDAIEEVTFTSAAQGADSAGQGAAQIRFVTRSGTNQFRGSAYYYHRNDALNANTWFNNRDLPPDPGTGKAPKPELMQHQPGFRIGGPIVLPKLFDGHNKAFFFFNYEELYQPDKPSRDRIVLSPDAARGIFRYNATVGGQTVTREVNLLQLAAKNGQTATMDPVVLQLLTDIQTVTSRTGGFSNLADPNLQRYTFQFDRESHNRYPTARIDYNLSKNHRLSGTYSFNKIMATPDTTNNRESYFPGFPLTGIQDSDRYVIGGTVRSTLGASMVNELRIGGTGGATLFSPNFTLDMWNGSLANTSGYHLNLNGACCGTGAALTNQGNTNARSSREASTKVVEDTLNWVRGSHSLSFGASWTQVDLWLKNQTLVPQVNFGVITGDPAESMFSATNFPGASTTVLNNAKGLYAILVGRVQSMTATARMNEATGEYEYLGLGIQRGRMREIGLHAQDSWRIRPNLTVNYGLRYELQLPFYATNSSYSTANVEDVWGVSGVGNLFKPGTLNGSQPTFKQLKEGTRAYAIDWNNLAPTLGFAWTAGAGHRGLLGKLLGDEGDTVFRAGYALAYNRHGMSDFSDVFGANPGVSITTNRDQSLGNLGPLPLLFRDRASRLTAPAFAAIPAYPMTDVITGDVNIFDPHLQVPYAMSWQAGIQRKITRDLAVEARYVGTRHLQGWTEYNYNEINVVENGFLNEFKLAQQNLEANIAAGRGANFRYYGPGTGTAPLPIMLAYFSGLGAGQAGDPSKYSSSSFASSAFVNALAKYNPNPCCITSSSNPSFAYSLYNNSTFRANAIKAGLPVNFFQVNPDLLGGANITSNGGYTKYDSMQLEFRKRSLSGGFQFQASYTYGKAYESRRYSFRTPRVKTLQSGTLGGVMHALKGNWVYELPFGRGKRFGSNAGPMLHRLIGGWEFDGLARWQSGQLMDFGNVRLVGMSVDEFKKLVKLRVGSDGQLYMLPQEIIDETVKAFSVSATSSTGYGALGAPSGRYLAPANSVDCLETVPGYGDCGVQSLVAPGPPLVRFDLSVVKRTAIKGRVNFEFRAEMLNALNHPYFYPVTGMNTYTSNASPSDGNSFGSTPSNYRITTGQTGREVQLVGRISW